MNKRIFIVIPGMKFGGMERVSFIMREMLIKHGYDVYLITLYDKNPDYHPDFEYYSLKGEVNNSKFGKVLSSIKRVVNMKKLKRKFNPDIVITFGINCAFASVFSKRKEKLYIGIRSYDWLYEYTYGYKIDKFIYQKADKVISVSKLIKNEAEKKFNINKNNSYYLYNPYDLNLINDKSKEEIDDFDLNTIRNKKVIVSVGRLENQKGFYHLIKAVNQLESPIKEKIIVLILGNGNKKDLLENMIKEKQLENTIYLLGGKSNPYKYMKLADLYVMSSITEGFPNSLVESMSLGIPVLSTDCKSGPKEILTDLPLDKEIEKLYFGKYGILINEVTDSKNYDANNIEECDIVLSDAIKKVLFDDKILKKYSKLSKERASLYSYDLFENNLIKILNDDN